MIPAAKFTFRPPANPMKMLWVLLCTLMSVLIVSTSANAAKRVALVIGNSAYKNASELANPANDAADMAAALSDLGFIVVTGVDLDSRGMREKVREFSNSLRGADTAMLYYAGHAMQVNGQNYLAPVDTKLEFESDLDFETIPLKFIQAQMEREAKTTLLFLDACRDNPLTRSFKASTRSQGAGRGLAKEDLASSGILIAFATNPENVALDGTGRNSPFTRAMLDNIRRPGVEISSLMTDVRVQVVKETSGQQTPWINSALLGRFYFNPDENAASTGTKTAALTQSTENKPAPPTLPIARSNAGVSNAQIAALAYDAIKDTGSISELEVFVSLYGNSFYGQLAKLKIKKLKEAKNDEVATTPKAPEVTADDTETKLAALTPEQVKTPEPEVDVAKPLDPYQVKFGIQEELDRLNCGPGRPDGLWGKRSQAALNKFSKRLKLVASSPTEALYYQLRKYDGRGCFVPKVKPKTRSVKTCPAGQRLSSKGQCYRPKTKTVKTCATGQKLSSKGNCYWPKTKKAKTCAAGQKLSRKGNCYTPKVKTVKACPSGQRRSSKGHCYTPVQKKPQVVQQCGPGQRRSSKGHCYTPRVVVEREVVRERKPSLGRKIIRGVVGGVVCGVSGNCN